MLASRVGVVGALLAVLILSAELGGAIAWKHHVATEPRVDRETQIQKVDLRVSNRARS